MLKIVLLCIFVFASCSMSNGKAVSGENEDWWEYGHFYQIYPRSFQDADGDGVGDLQGIIQRLPHLKTINVTGVWLSPIFKSPMKDFGYDISDYRDVDPVFGTLDDFDQLAAKCRELDIKLILDFVPNHSSNEHKWFIASADPNHPEHEKYKDFYIWNKGKVLENGTRSPPSNWISVFRGSAWTWVESRKEYYLHQFLAEQPDLNYRNEVVVEEMKEILRYWLRKGVSGFRCDAVPLVFEGRQNGDGYYDDEPLSGDCDDPEDACYLKHIHTRELDESRDMIYEWRKVIDEDEFSEYSRILMIETSSNLTNTLSYYGRVENGELVVKGSQIPFNFDLITLNRSSTAGDFQALIERWMDNMPKAKGVHANWVLDNHDIKRTASRLNPKRIDLFNILSKTLPGITVTYNGEEIGMTDVFLTWEETVDPQACRTNPNDYDTVSRDPARTPFQWSGEKNAGFSSAEKTWLPVAKNYTVCNVDLQKYQEISHLKNFRKLISLRENPTLKYGELQIKALDENVLAFKRQISDQTDVDIFAIVLNLGSTNKVIDLSTNLDGIPEELKVVVASIHSQGLVAGDIVKSGEFVIPPEVGLVLVGRQIFY